MTSKKRSPPSEEIKKLVEENVKTSPAEPSKIVHIHKLAFLIKILSVFLIVLGMVLALDSFVSLVRCMPRIGHVKHEFQVIKNLFSNPKESHQEARTPRKNTHAENPKEITFAAFDLENPPENNGKISTLNTVLNIVDKTLISITILYTGFLLLQTSGAIQVESLSDALKGVDTAIISMVIIAVSIHFLLAVLEESHKINIEYSVSVGFLILCLTAYYFITKHVGHVEKAK